VKVMGKRVIRFVVVPIIGLQALTMPAAGQQTMGAYKDLRQLPNTPAGKRLREVIDVINAEDQAKTKKFVAESMTPAFRDAFPLAEHLTVFNDVFNATGGVEFYSVRQYDKPRGEGELVGIVRTKIGDSWRGIIVGVEPDPPHRIATLNFAPARPPSDLPDAGKKLTQAELVEELKQYLDKVVKGDLFSGTVLLAKNGDVLFRGAYGQANRDFDASNRVDTKFNLGSMNKMFTAVAIAQLAERGKLSYDDPISKCLSTDWLPGEVADKVTIRHLLTHTSGLGSYFNDKFMNSSRALYRKVDDYKPLVADEKPAFEPGTRWAYSNTGFLLLGAVIEKVTGESYFDSVRDNVFKPAGMTGTDSYELDRVNPNLAVGYSKVADETGTHWKNNLFEHVIKGGPAGGGYSTVEDLLKFDQAMRANKLVKKETADLMWTPTPQSRADGPGYGFGFGVSGEPGNRMVGHTGGFPGINSRLDMYLDKGVTVAVMSNYDRGAELVGQKLAELLVRLE